MKMKTNGNGDFRFRLTDHDSRQWEKKKDGYCSSKLPSSAVRKVMELKTLKGLKKPTVTATGGSQATLSKRAKELEWGGELQKSRQNHRGTQSGQKSGDVKLFGGER